MLEKLEKTSVVKELIKTGLRVYSVPQITTATFFGGPLAGFLLLAQNFKIFGNTEGHKKALIYGVLITAAMLIIASLLPEKFSVGLPFAAIHVLRLFAKQWQEQTIAQYLASGSILRSYWSVAGYTLLGLAITSVFVIVGITYLMMHNS